MVQCALKALVTRIRQSQCTNEHMYNLVVIKQHNVNASYIFIGKNKCHLHFLLLVANVFFVSLAVSAAFLRWMHGQMPELEYVVLILDLALCSIIIKY